MQVIWCLKFCNMPKSGGGTIPRSIFWGDLSYLPPRDLRPCFTNTSLEVDLQENPERSGSTISERTAPAWRWHLETNKCATKNTNASRRQEFFRRWTVSLELFACRITWQRYLTCTVWETFEDTLVCVGLRLLVTIAFLHCVQIFSLTYLLTYRR